MPWQALEAEIAVEFRSLSPSPWDAIEQRKPERDEEERSVEARAALKRRIAVLHAVGKVREARRLESHLRACARRRKANREGSKRS